MSPDDRIPRPHFLDRELRDTCETLLRLVSQSEPDLREIARLAQTVDRLHQRVMKAANASSLGLTSPILSAEQAVAFLGTKRVQEIVDRFLQEHRRMQSPT